MVKVMQIRSSFDPGGTETLLLNLFNHRQQSFQIHFVLLKDGTLIHELDPNSGNRYYTWFRKRFFDISVFIKMHQLKKRENISVVHVHQFIELFYAVCLKFLNPGLKIIHHKHLMFEKRNLAFYLERWLCRLCSKILTVSNSAKEELVQRFGFRAKDISILYNAVNAGKPQKLNGHAPVFELDKLKLTASRFNILMVANFVWGKDHQTVFQAYDRFIRDQLPQVSFYFVGRKSEISQKLVQQYLIESDLEKRRIVLCGAIPNAKSLLPAFDMVVMSSFSETFNIALVEAASAGKVILASDIPVFRELSQNGKYFSLFKTGSPEDLFEKLQQLIPKISQISTIDQANYFSKKFAYPTFVRQLNDIYSA